MGLLPTGHACLQKLEALLAPGALVQAHILHNVFAIIAILMIIESYMLVFANVYSAQTHEYVHACEYTPSTHPLPNLLVLNLLLQRPALVASTRVRSATLHGRAQCHCMCAAPR